MTLLVTGGAGFIGANFVRDWLAQCDEPIVNLDKLTYAGNLENLKSLQNDPRHVFVRGDIGDQCPAGAIPAARGAELRRRKLPAPTATRSPTSPTARGTTSATPSTPRRSSASSAGGRARPSIPVSRRPCSCILSTPTGSPT